MAYGQKNYNELQGIAPQKYRINQIGCFLVAFSNLLQRFGKDVNPVNLNAVFRDRKIYVDVDDGVKDDLGWGSVSAYDGNVVVAQSANNAIVPSSNCIVRIKANNAFGTHFCLVDRIENGVVYIVDSWDGSIKKSSYYGPITGWAEYRNTTPQPVQPVVPPPPAPVADNSTIVVQAGWGISHVAKAAGYPDFATQARWDAIAQLNGHANASTFRLFPNQKVVVRGSAPTPAPAPAPQEEIVNITVQPGWGISHVLKAAGYNKEQWENPAEWLRMSALNGAAAGTNIRLQPNQIVKVNRSPIPAPAPAPAPVPVAVVAPEPAKTPEPVKTDPEPLVLTKPGWKTSFKAERKVFVASESIIVKDLAGMNLDLQLVKGQKVRSGGIFEKDGVAYARTEKSVTNDWWYGIPLTALGSGQEPDKYVGPLVDDDDDDDIFKLPLDLKEEAKELYKNLSTREKLVAVVAKTQGFIVGIFSFINVFKKKTKK